MADLEAAVMRRVLLLRQTSLFAGAALEELATMGESVNARVFAPGDIVVTANERVRTLHVVVEGRIETPSERFEVRDVFGALEVAAVRPASATAVATVSTRTLELTATLFEEVLEDNVGVMTSVLRALAMRVTPASLVRSALVMDGSRELGFVDRLFVLRGLFPFTSARVAALAGLAQSSEEIRAARGTVLVVAGDAATSGLVIVDGSVRCTRGDEVRDAGPGAAFGHIEALAQVAFAETVVATSDVRVLRSPVSAVLDMIEDHPDVGFAMLSTLAGHVLDQSSGESLVATGT